MNLEFLYYQEKGILDGSDPKMIEFRPYIEEFKEYLSQEKLSDIIILIIDSYLDKYAQFKYFFSGLYKSGSYGLKISYPSYVDLEEDFYLSNEEMNRMDLSFAYFNNFYDEDNTNGVFLDELVLSFVNKETGIETAVEEVIRGVNYLKVATDNGFLYKLRNTPILEISVASKEFRMKLNPEKWEVYV